MKTQRIFLFGVLFLLLSAAVFCLVSVPPKAKTMEIENGIVTLPESLDSRLYSLDGTWRFRHGGFYAATEMEQADTIFVPGDWAMQGFPEGGAATYQLILVSAKPQNLSLQLTEIVGAYELYLNGELISYSGTIGLTALEEQPDLSNHMVELPLQEGKNELLLWVSNHYIKDSGIVFHLLLGEHRAVEKAFFYQRIAASVVLGAFLLVGIYQLLLYSFRTKEKEYLLVGLMCISTFLRFLGDSNGILQYFSPFPLGVVFLKTSYLFYLLHVLLVCVFTYVSFSIKPGKVGKVIHFICFVVPLLAVLILRPIDAVLWMTLLTIPIVLSAVAAARSKAIRKQPFLLLYFISLVLYVILGGYFKLYADASFFMTGLSATFFMLLVQAALLADRYSYAMRRMETENQRLEQTVAERTVEVTKVNAQLVASQNALREMLRGISHDLKTPITVLSQYLELLKLDAVPKTAEEEKQYVQIAYQKNLDIQRLIKGLFEVARMEMGEVPIKMEWLNAENMQNQMVAKYGGMLREKGIIFTIDLPKVSEIYADRDRLWSIFDNLIYNAMRYTPPEGTIAVHGALEEGGRMMLSVSDTGTGIAKEHLPHIFERFYKGSKSRGENDGESGLGLYIVKTLLEQMSSEVFVESEVRKGSQFSFALLERQISV